MPTTPNDLALALQSDPSTDPSELIAALEPVIRAKASRGSTQQLADDAVQRVQAYIFETRLKSWDSSVPIEAHIRKVAYNRLRDARKEEKRLSRLASETDAPFSGLPADQTSISRKARHVERAEWIRASIDQLPEREREITRLRYVEGLDPSEVQERLGLTKGAYGSLNSRAIARLSELMKRDDGDHSVPIPRG